MADDYYGVLGVTREATSQEIKRAFREIARRCHPDVVGDDVEAEERFKRARKAYETLMDPVARTRYDRRGQRASGPPGSGHGAPGSFFDAFYRATERNQRPAGVPPGGRMRTGQPPGSTGPGPASTVRTDSARRHAPRNPGNAVDLDDLLNDFGFGGARVSPRAGSAPRQDGGAPPRQSQAAGAGGGFQEARVRGAAAPPEPGEDVHVDLEAPADVARSGGSLTAVYYRMQRADSWRPGAPDPGLVRVQDIADIRVLPGTADGEVLRERGLGSAGSHGGPYGDLIVTVRVVGRAPEPGQPGAAEGEATDQPTVDLSVVEALLGGRVSLDTPQGRVRLTIPPGTSSGVRLRLKGRGPVGPDGAPTDWYVVTRIVVPKELDAESRRLIEEYARLNPSPHDG
jgi:curved DNA-binding protein